MISNGRSQFPKPWRKGASHKPPQKLLNVLHSTIKSTWSGCIHKAAMLPPLMGSSQIQGTHRHKHRELCNSNQFSNYLLQKQKKDHRDLQLPQNCVKQRAGTKKDTSQTSYRLSGHLPDSWHVPPTVDKGSSRTPTTSLTSHFVPGSCKDPTAVDKGPFVPPSHSAIFTIRTIPKALDKGSLSQASSTTCQHLPNLSTSSQGAVNSHGEDTKPRPTCTHFSGVPCRMQASHTHQHRRICNPVNFSNISSSLQAHEGTPWTWKRVGTGTFSLPITVSHPDMGPTRHFSKISFSTRLLQRLSRIGKRKLGKKKKTHLWNPSWCER